MPILKPSPSGSGTSHPDGCYYVNAITGEIQRQCNPFNAAFLAGAGYMGKGWVPATPFNAFGSFADAQKFAEEIGKARGGILQFPFGGPGPGVRTTPQGPMENPSTGTPIPGTQPGAPSTPDQGSDWAHLMTRLAEFGIGAILVIIGFNAIVSRTKGYQKVETVVTGVAGKVPIA